MITESSTSIVFGGQMKHKFMAFWGKLSQSYAQHKQLK